MKKKFLVLTSILVAICATLGVFYFYSFQEAKAYKISLENTYQHALKELSHSISKMESYVQKGIFANTLTQQQALSSKILLESESAKAAIGSLSIEGIEFNNVIKFLSQIGDYTSYLCNKLAANEKVSEDEMKMLSSFLEYTRKLKESTDKILNMIEKGNKNFVDLSKKIEKDTESFPEFSQGFSDINSLFNDYPNLIYDGMFSDHIPNKESIFLKEKPNLSDQELLEKCSEFLNIDSSNLSADGETNSNFTSIRFKSSENIYISITRSGGYIDNMNNTRPIGGALINTDNAINAASNFLKKVGFENMVPTFYRTSNEICTINFVYTQDSIICYSDVIKIGVALDNGDIVSFDSKNYLMNHTERKTPETIISEDEASKKISPLLFKDKISKVFCQTPGLSEALCYEFICHDEKGQKVVVLINSISGFEQQIFLLDTSSEGNKILI